MPEPIEINPSYNECFQMAQDALRAEQIGMAMEADMLEGAAVTDVPVETPETRKRKENAAKYYPGLGGEKDFEQALLESGAEIIIDPADPDGAPKVELGSARPPEPAPEPAAEPEQEPAAETPPEPTAAEIFQQKKDVCRIKYGISF